jgi:N-ethylmaleimide reductase
MVTEQAGPQQHPVPVVMTELDIEQSIQEHVVAAGLALEAGFDGVELHAANGFLVNQFLDPAANQRTDDWGGSAGNRARFALEILSRVSARIGCDRVGIRLSPGNAYNGMVPYFPDRDDLYLHLAQACRDLKLAYIHLADFGSFGLPALPSALRDAIRAAFDGPIILSGGFERERAEAALAEDLGDLIAFGRPFVANPRLVSRMRSGGTMAPFDAATLYTAGPTGYVDYP